MRGLGPWLPSMSQLGAAVGEAVGRPALPPRAELAVLLVKTSRLKGLHVQVQGPEPFQATASDRGEVGKFAGVTDALPNWPGLTGLPQRA